MNGLIGLEEIPCAIEGIARRSFHCYTSYSPDAKGDSDSINAKTGFLSVASFQCKLEQRDSSKVNIRSKVPKTQAA